MRSTRRPATGRWSAMFASAMVALAASTAATAETYYVNDAIGNDDWDGLCEEWDGGTCGPKKTIAAAMTDATDGDDVSVADGVYTGWGNYSIVYHGEAINLHSANGPDNCILDMDYHEEGVIKFIFEEQATSVLDGFTIINCGAC